MCPLIARLGKTQIGFISNYGDISFKRCQKFMCPVCRCIVDNNDLIEILGSIFDESVKTWPCIFYFVVYRNNYRAFHSPFLPRNRVFMLNLIIFLFLDDRRFTFYINFILIDKGGGLDFPGKDTMKIAFFFAFSDFIFRIFVCLLIEHVQN